MRALAAVLIIATAIGALDRLAGLGLFAALRPCASVGRPSWWRRR